MLQQRQQRNAEYNEAYCQTLKEALERDMILTTKKSILPHFHFSVVWSQCSLCRHITASLLLLSCHWQGTAGAIYGCEDLQGAEKLMSPRRQLGRLDLLTSSLTWWHFQVWTCRHPWLRVGPLRAMLWESPWRDDQGSCCMCNTHSSAARSMQISGLLASRWDTH